MNPALRRRGVSFEDRPGGVRAMPGPEMYSGSACEVSGMDLTSSSDFMFDKYEEVWCNTFCMALVL